MPEQPHQYIAQSPPEQFRKREGGRANRLAYYCDDGLAVYVTAEKVLPAGQRISLLGGAGLIVWGVALLVGVS